MIYKSFLYKLKCILLLYVSFLIINPSFGAEEIKPETRAVWLSRDVILNGTEQMYDTFRKLAEANFNCVLVNVFYFGGTIYPSDVVEAAGGQRQLPEYRGRDPLAEAIEIGHNFDLEVVAWFEYGLMAHYSAGDTSDSGPILSAHPDWEAIARNGEHWQENQFGIFHWYDPAHPEVVQFLTDIFAEISANYPELDGIETDRIRYPSQDFSYGAISRNRYTNETGNFDPLSINSSHPQWADWLDWREQQTTNLARKIYHAVKTTNPAMLVSAAVVPPYMRYNRVKLQAWNVWADSGYVDALEPMLYVDDSSLPNQLNEALGFVPEGFLLYPGVSYTNTGSLQFQIETIRQSAARGITIWYLGSMTDNTYDYLKNGPFSYPAALPHNQIIIDNADANRFGYEGNWNILSAGYGGTSLLNESGAGEAHWLVSPLKSAQYQIFSRWAADDENTRQAAYRIVTASLDTTVYVDQSQKGDQWHFLLSSELDYDDSVRIELRNASNGKLNADAVQLNIPERFLLLDWNFTDSMHLALNFSRPLEQTAAEKATHYQIDQSISIINAQQDEKDASLVHLKTTAFEDGNIYNLSVNGLRDIHRSLLPAIDAEIIYDPEAVHFLIDNGESQFKTYGVWRNECTLPGFHGVDYLTAAAGSGENRAQWWQAIKYAGNYAVAVNLPEGNSELASNARYTVLHRYGIDTVWIDQRSGQGDWRTLGIFPYAENSSGSILLSNDASDGKIIADALRIRRVIKPTAIGDSEMIQRPAKVSLQQNFPNPFNAKTVIRYSLSVDSEIELSIFNILGQKVTILVFGKKSAGNHRVVWDARGFASGVYLCKLSTDRGFTEVGKLLLIK